jgi:hypothetical protein
MARTSTLWRLLPARELGSGSATTCWRRLTEWVEAGVRLGSAATAGGSSAPGRGWAASGGCGSATSASLSGCRPWPCWPARSSASTPSSSHRGERPDGRSSRQARAPDARSPISIPIATGRPGLRWMGSARRRYGPAPTPGLRTPWPAGSPTAGMRPYLGDVSVVVRPIPGFRLMWRAGGTADGTTRSAATGAAPDGIGDGSGGAQFPHRRQV